MTRSHVITIAKVLLAALIVGFLVATGKLSVDPLRQTLERPWAWGGYCALYFGILLLSVWRWNLILRSSSEVTVPFWSLVRFTWIGLFFSNVIPSTLGTDASKYAYLQREGMSGSDIVGSLVLDRTAGLSALLLLLLAFGLPLAAHVMDARTLSVVVSGLVLGGCAAALVHRFRARLGLADKLERFRDSLRKGLADRKAAVLALVISIATQLLKVASVMLILAAAGELDLSLQDVLGVCSVGFFIEKLPLTPAGLGTSHVAFDYLLSLHDVAGGAALYNVYFLGRIALHSVGALLWIGK